MEINLDGKIALVTASSKGIGFGVAKVLSKCGADVILLSRNRENLEKASQKIKEESGKKPYYVVADLTNEKSLEKAMDEIEKMEPSIFFFSTGGPKPGSFLEMESNDWENAISLLIKPAIYITRRLLPKMIERKWGRIIYSTSTAIKEIIPNLALSNVIRVSLAGLTRNLAKEVGKYGITVNGIMPGIIKTDRIKEIAKNMAAKHGMNIDEAMKELAAPIPAGRLGEAEEIGYLAAFLASDYASYVNGAIIPVDGGRLNSIL